MNVTKYLKLLRLFFHLSAYPPKTIASTFVRGLAHYYSTAN